MTVEQLSESAYYRYRIRVHPDNRTPLQDVIDWANDLKIDCIVHPGSAFVRTMDDALLFMLRWS